MQQRAERPRHAFRRKKLTTKASKLKKCNLSERYRNFKKHIIVDSPHKIINYLDIDPEESEKSLGKACSKFSRQCSPFVPPQQHW